MTIAPPPPPPQTMLKITHQFQNLTSTLYRGRGTRQEYFSNDANGTPFEQSVPRIMAIVVGRLLSLHRKIKTVAQTILRKSKHQIKIFF